MVAGAGVQEGLASELYQSSQHEGFYQSVVIIVHGEKP